MYGLLNQIKNPIPSQETLDSIELFAIAIYDKQKIKSITFIIVCFAHHSAWGATFHPLKMPHISMHYGPVTRHTSGGGLWWRSRLFLHQQGMGQ